MSDLIDLQAAIRVARKRTRDLSIGVSVSNGRFNVVRAIKQKGGKFDIESLDGGQSLTIKQAVDFLLSLG